MTIQRTKVFEYAGIIGQVHSAFQDALVGPAPSVDFFGSDHYQLVLYRCIEDDKAAAERRGILSNVKQLIEKLDPQMNAAEWKEINERRLYKCDSPACPGLPWRVFHDCAKEETNG